jgi:hypothetical protein
MGSQVNFYLMREDEEAFCRFIASDPAVVILYETRLDKPLVPVEPPVPDAETQWCGFFSLWNASIVSRDLITPPNRLVGGQYDINAFVYPVIEFWRSSLTPEGASPGRIWATFEHECPNNEQQKAFRAWFRHLANWLNKLPYRWDMYRIGPHAKAYFDAGGKAVGYGLGEVKAVEAIGQDERLVRRGVKRYIAQPEIERDEGATDLTIDLDE